MPCHLQAFSVIFFDEHVQFVSPIVKTLINSTTFWNCQGENVRAVIQGLFVDLLKTGENILGFEAVAQIVSATEYNYPVILLSSRFFTFSMFRLVILGERGRNLKYG
jgi:hypothetical protein